SFEEVILISSNEYIKYITEQIVSYLDKTPEEKKEMKKMQQKQKGYNRRLSGQWFGMLAISLKLFMKKDYEAGIEFLLLIFFIMCINKTSHHLRWRYLF